MIYSYAELHCHSSFSLLDGASNPEELVERARELGLAALALTDHDDLGGAIRFSHAAKEAGVNGIIGAELSMEGETHLTVLAKTLKGYKNICSLITGARMSCGRGMPRVRMSDLANHSEGLLVLSGCPNGAIPSLIARGQFDDAVLELKQLRDIFSEDFFLELWNHNIAQESIICRQLLELSSRWSVPWVVTNNVHYAYPEKRIIHDVLTCLRHEVTLSTAGRRLRPNGSWYLKSAQEMIRQWQNYPEGIENTLIVAERCEFRLGLLKPELPQINLQAARDCLARDDLDSLGQPVCDDKNRSDYVIHAQPGTGVHAQPEPCVRTEPEHNFSFLKESGESRNEILKALTWKGAKERYGEPLKESQLRQLHHELDLITRLDLAPYFLIMWDIIRFAASQGIAVQGRGSAANSAVCYCLKITAVDPIAMDLLFERFISEDRHEPPDIDLDIAHQEREKVLQYVYEKYGREHAAMVCEHITYRGPSAVRDAARVFDFSPEQQDKLSAQAHHHEADSAAQALADGGAAAAGLDPRDRKVQLLIQVVHGLYQLPRHRSIHVGGFVLSGEPIGSIVPVEPASMPGRTVIQWDKDDLDLAGLIKIDLLGLGMLTLIQEGLKLIQQHRGITIDLAKLDMDDQQIYGMMQRADTMGVFQIESRAQMSILPKIRPRCFYDVVVSIAIVRPGPIQGNIVHPYLRRRRGLEEVTYLHPTIEPILKRTLGVPLFQEQGMKLAVVAAGFTPSQADQLRRVMSHKRSVERMAKVCVQLADGMRANGLSEEAIETITFQLRAFANYGFPESHAASFALLVFASAFMKYYYGPEFYCAILNAQPMGFYSPATLIRDAMRHDIEVRPIDLSKSVWNCTLEDNLNGVPSLRIGLRFVLGLGPGAKLALENAWANGGKFISLEDVCKRSGLRQRDLERLAQAGAFESLCKGRRRALWSVLKVLKRKREFPLLKYFEERLCSLSTDSALQVRAARQATNTDVNVDFVAVFDSAAIADADAAAAAIADAAIADAAIADAAMDSAAAFISVDNLTDYRDVELGHFNQQFKENKDENNNVFEVEAQNTELPYLPAMTAMEITIADFNITGLSTGNHPMVFFREWAAKNSVFSCEALLKREHGERLTIAGSVICRQRPHTAKGFVFMTIEDETGTANIIINPNVFEQYRQAILQYNFVAISGRLQLEEGVVNVIADAVQALPTLTSQEQIHIASRDFH